jgi:peptidoglycan/xylan/chitin deacetylase (PgdA/CDA1 family)
MTQADSEPAARSPSRYSKKAKAVTMNTKIHIPALMYHEIFNAEHIAQQGHYRMTPHYYLPISEFVKQMTLLSDMNYQCVLPEELERNIHFNKPLLITFDDGFIGNFKYALPVLKSFGFKAIFFVIADQVGKTDFMDWPELSGLSENGMSIQSHTFSHRPLQNLSALEIETELRRSKELIEKRLKNKVTALSFPHGSYNDDVIKIGRELGYKYFFNSEVAENRLQRSVNEPMIFNRVAVSSNLSLGSFSKCLNPQSLDYRLLKFKKNSKNLLKRTIGVENYRRLYRYVFSIKK